MGEQGSEAEEAAHINPFLRRSVAFSVADRLRMVDEIAMARKLAYSSHLREIISNPENFYQQGQQSAKMAEDAHRRRHESFNTRREAFIQQKRSEQQPLPARIGMIDINPTIVTLSLEFESQYYHLMTNVYGEHENLASIMAETNTLIQLPDQLSDVPTSDPFVQQVTITGRYNDVDKARKLMRENCHVSVFMSLSEVKISPHELEKIVHENTIPNVEIQFCNTSQGNGEAQYHICFTSRSKNEMQLIEATNIIMGKVFDGEVEPPANQFSLHFTLSTFHVEHVVGQPSTTLLMPEVETRTKTKITYPKFNTRDDINSNIFEIVIVGETKNVLEARKYIIELLPISICFNIKNTDMAAAPSKQDDRRIHAMLQEERTMIKVTPSMYEPAELLSGEVALHCGSLRSKEFNIKNLYAAYQKVLSAEIDIVAPQPDNYDNSIWHESLPLNFFSFTMQCRGEAPDSTFHMRRNRTTSVTSCRSKRSHSNKGRMSSEPSGVDSKSSTRVASSVENAAVPIFMQFPHHGGPPMFFTAPMNVMKGPYPIPAPFYFRTDLQYGAHYSSNVYPVQPAIFFSS